MFFDWGEMEEKGEVVKTWQPKKPRKSKKKLPPPKRPPNTKRLQKTTEKESERKELKA